VELVRVCVEAGVQAALEIRRCTFGLGRDVRESAVLKDATDPRSALTEADTAAQRVALRVIRERFPDARIIAEEDEEVEDFSAGSGAEIKSCVEFEMDPTLIDSCRSELRAVPNKHVVVFCDPLDGTREYVIGNLAAVFVLIGVAIHGGAVAGVLVRPFPPSAPDSPASQPHSRCSPHVIYGIVGAGVFGLNFAPCNNNNNNDSLRSRCLTLAGSEGAPRGAVARAEHVFREKTGAARIVRGGCANKVYALLVGDADLTLFNLSSSAWDTCATEAVLRAAGGDMSDLCGSPLPHDDARSGDQARNSLGVFASSSGLAAFGISHSQLAAELRAARVADELLENTGLCSSDESNEASASDIARDLSGRPLSVEWLSRALGFIESRGQNSSGMRLAGFRTPESSAVRYLQSTAVRVELVYEHEGTQVDGDVSPPPIQSVFYKRCVMRELAHAMSKAALAPQKLLRDVSSHEVEAAFLASSACRLASSAARVPIPRAFYVEHEIDRVNPLNSRFATILQDFSAQQRWHQRGELPATHMCAALNALARMHAFFWRTDAAQTHAFLSEEELIELRAAVWPRATYWTLDRQPATQLRDLDSNWKATRERFERELRATSCVGFVTAGGGSLFEASETVGEQLAALAKELDDEVHGGARGDPFRTVIHGDPKAANLFFRELPANAVASGSTLLGDGVEDRKGQGRAQQHEAGMIDFQWSGFGLCAVDVVYLIASSCAIEELDTSGEKEVDMLRSYHSALLDALVEFKHAPDRAHAESRLAPWLDLRDLYRACFLDLARIVFAYHWPRIKASPAVLQSRQKMLGSNTYNKSTPHMLWFVARTVENLESYMASKARNV